MFLLSLNVLHQEIMAILSFRKPKVSYSFVIRMFSRKRYIWRWVSKKEKKFFVIVNTFLRPGVFAFVWLCVWLFLLNKELTVCRTSGPGINHFKWLEWPICLWRRLIMTYVNVIAYMLVKHFLDVWKGTIFMTDVLASKNGSALPAKFNSLFFVFFFS